MIEFWRPAEPYTQVWRTILGFALMIGAFFAATFAVFTLAGVFLGTSPSSFLSGESPISAGLFFATFIGFHIGLVIVLPILHKRGYTSLFGPNRRLNLRHFALGTLVAVLIATALYSIMFFERVVLPAELSPMIEQVRPVSDWLVWLLPALLLIFLQTFAEEAIFRGYLLQQLRARFRSIWIWAVLPSLIFGLLHFDAATYGTMNAATYVINTTATGIMLCLVTIRTGNLGAAAGLHFANNASLTVIGIEGTLDGFSLFTVGMDPQSGYTAYSILFQTGFNILLFALWWLWMNRRDKIANTAFAA